MRAAVERAADRRADTIRAIDFVSRAVSFRSRFEQADRFLYPRAWRAGGCWSGMPMLPVAPVAGGGALVLAADVVRAGVDWATEDGRCMSVLACAVCEGAGRAVGTVALPVRAGADSLTLLGVRTELTFCRSMFPPLLHAVIANVTPTVEAASAIALLYVFIEPSTIVVTGIAPWLRHATIMP